MLTNLYLQVDFIKYGAMAKSR